MTNLLTTEFQDRQRCGKSATMKYDERTIEAVNLSSVCVVVDAAVIIAVCVSSVLYIVPNWPRNLPWEFLLFVYEIFGWIFAIRAYEREKSIKLIFWIYAINCMNWNSYLSNFKRNFLYFRYLVLFFSKARSLYFADSLKMVELELFQFFCGCFKSMYNLSGERVDT